MKPFELDYSYILLVFTSILVYFGIFTNLDVLLKESNRKYFVLFTLLIIVYFTLVKMNGIQFIIESALTLFIFWMVLFGFNINRKHIYLLAILFLIAVPFLLIIDLDNIAEYIAVLAYFCIVLGVLKDIFYEKIYS